MKAAIIERALAIVINDLQVEGSISFRARVNYEFGAGRAARLHTDARGVQQCTLGRWVLDFGADFIADGVEKHDDFVARDTPVAKYIMTIT